MLIQPQTRPSARAIGLTRLIGWMALVLAWGTVFSGARDAVAAGCHADARLPLLFDVSQISAGHSIGSDSNRLYQDGRLSVFPKLEPSSLPCDGPGCRSKQPQRAPEVVVVVPRVQNDVTVTGCQSESAEVPTPVSYERVPVDALLLSEVFSSGLFRPPRTS